MERHADGALPGATRRDRQLGRSPRPGGRARVRRQRPAQPRVVRHRHRPRGRQRRRSHVDRRVGAALRRPPSSEWTTWASRSSSRHRRRTSRMVPSRHRHDEIVDAVRAIGLAPAAARRRGAPRVLPVHGSRELHFHDNLHQRDAGSGSSRCCYNAPYWAGRGSRDRLGGMLQDTFGRPTIVARYGSGAFHAAVLANGPGLSGALGAPAGAEVMQPDAPAAVPTDAWPCDRRRPARDRLAAGGDDAGEGLAGGRPPAAPLAAVPDRARGVRADLAPVAPPWPWSSGSRSSWCSRARAGSGCRSAASAPISSCWGPRSCCSRREASVSFSLLFGNTWVVNALLWPEWIAALVDTSAHPLGPGAGSVGRARGVAVLLLTLRRPWARALAAAISVPASTGVSSWCWLRP